MGKKQNMNEIYTHTCCVSSCCILRKRKSLSIDDCWNRSIFDNFFRRQLDFLNLPERRDLNDP